MTGRSSSLDRDPEEEISSEFPVEQSVTANPNPSRRWYGWYRSQGKYRRFGFVVVNLWLAFHLFAISICPASMEPTSRFLFACFQYVSPYLNLLYLDHGFHYFAPEPGPSTLVGYTLEFGDGTTKTGRFPNRTIWPRLLYHRYFMLSEFIGNCPEQKRPLIERAFARNLCRETGATKVSLTMITHEMPSVNDVRGGMSLNDESLFKETSLGTYTVDELRQPYVPKATESVEESPMEAGSPELTRNSP